MKLKNVKHLLWFAALCLVACNSASDQANVTEAPKVEKEAIGTIIIDANDFLSAEGVDKSEANHVSITNEKVWMEYVVNIPEAGRYQFEISASAASDSASVWVEDYIDNKDDRTYNITGSIDLPKNENFLASSVDGSPLNKGIHQIKLHVEGGNVKIDKFSFRLMKKHQLTPKTLTQKTEGTEWKIAWSDEFDGEGIPDTSKWTFDIGDWGWGNNELQYYTEHRTKNARLENGNLIIEAHKDDMSKQWTSARLTTRGKVTFRYGRIEFRAKVPPFRGNWAAGWTLGDKYVDELSWPYCGEIDILESVGYEMDDETGDGEAHASVHCGAYYFKLGNHHTGTVDVKNMHKEFHTYAVDWTPDGITAYVDDQEYFKYDDTSTELAWPFNDSQNIILNLAIGGGWGGAKGLDENMTSQQFVLDYVRVYEKQ